MTRRFFTKHLNVVHPPKPPKRPKAQDHKRRVVMGVRTTGAGTLEHKAMSSRTAAQVLGGQKGGLKSAALGTAYRWTTETARKAAVKSWTKRRKFNKRIGTRVGMKTNRRPRLWREPLRQYYAENMTRHITYNLFSGQWYRLGRIVSERAALTALGHLSTVRGFIPDSVTHSPRHSEKA